MRLLRTAAFLVPGSLLALSTFVACGDGDENSFSSGGTGGTAGDDGGATGGTGGTGGTAATGGTGGVGGTDGGACTAAFVVPADGVQLTEQDDASGDLCADGFQFDVRAAVSGAEGDTATLFAGMTMVAQATVTSGVAAFDGVQLSSNGSTELRVSVDSGCEDVATVTVTCAGAPTCEIVAPTISPTHPKLNGVPVADGGDRVSADGAPYAVAVEVDTSIPDGQNVLLSVSGNATGLSAAAMGGKAVFPSVVMSPDGDFEVSAQCISGTGINGMSAVAQYTVDTQAPDLALVKTKQGGVRSPLQAGDSFSIDDDVDTGATGLQMEFCGTTAAADALDLPASLGSGQSNFCVAIGTGSPTCVPATTAGAGSSGDGACVTLDCPGNGVFEIASSLRDDAGNPTAVNVQSLTCVSSNPSVQFLDPVGDTPPYSDVSKRILAANAPAGQRKDQDPNTLGAQYDVVACTTAVDGTGELFGGREGDTLASLGTAPVEPDTNSLCPSQFPNIINFTGVTVPDSSTGQGFVLDKPTQLQVEVTEVSSAMGQASITLWVDSQIPSLTIAQPAGLCGTFFQSSMPVVRNVRFNTSVAPVNFTLDGTPVPNQGPLTFGTVTFPNVSFPVGTSQLEASITKPSGNVGFLQVPCTVDVGATQPPTVTWQEPVAGSRLGGENASGAGVIADADGGAADWQGTLRVCTNIDTGMNPGATVQFAANGADIGSPVTLDGSGCATLDPATVPEGDNVMLSATTSMVGGATGSASITVPVDVTPPAVVTNLAGAVRNRRQTSFDLTWTAPDDGGKAVASYEIRVSESVIDTEAKFNAAESIVYGTTPSAPGTADSDVVADRLIEHDYFFAVAATDVGGNRGPIEFTTAATRASFLTTEVLPTTTGQLFGSGMDGSSDLNGDGFSDILIGHAEGQDARIHFGSATGIGTSPAVTITGATINFGESVSVIGDVNGDGRRDIAIGSRSEGNGRVYVYYGRASWPATLTDANADVVVDVDQGADPAFSGAQFGYSIARLGDFNGDGVSDFGVGAIGYGSNRGLVAVVFGKMGGLGAAVTLPNPSAGLLIRGPQGGTFQFGWSVLGLGGFYGTAQRGLIASEPFRNTNQGRLYAFRGQAGVNGLLDISLADDTFDGGTRWFTGFTGLQALGPIGSGNRPAYGMPNSFVQPSGQASALSGTPSTGPFAQQIANLNTAGPATAQQFAEMVVGGGFSGTAVFVSHIGSSNADLVVSTRAGGAPRLFIIDGDKVPSLGSALQNIEPVADVTVALPGTYTNIARYVTAAFDVNGDGFGDLAVGDSSVGAPIDGRVVVLY